MQAGTMAESQELVTLTTSARRIRVTRPMLVNDDLGAFTDFAAMSNVAKDTREKLAAAFTLCVLEGRSGPEAAEILEVPLGTVKTHVRRARLALQVKLRRATDEEGSAAP